MAPLLSLAEVTKCSACRPAIESLGNARCELAGRQLMTEDCDAPPKMSSKDQDAFGVGVSATDVVGHVGVSHVAEYNVASVLDPSSLTPTTYLLDVAFEMVVDIELRGSSAKRVEMRFANLKRAVRHGRLLVRSPYWCAKLVARPVLIGDAGVLTAPVAGVKRAAGSRAGDKSPGAPLATIADFRNKIATIRTSPVWDRTGEFPRWSGPNGLDQSLYAMTEVDVDRLAMADHRIFVIGPRLVAVPSNSSQLAADRFRA
jgi:hypothetical protein